MLKRSKKKRKTILDTAAIFRFHLAMTRKFGEGSGEALGWKTRESQQARYKVLVEMADLHDCSVMDVG